eukprot:13431537-Ditylum_brightwellii.AAC.1
MEIKQVQDIVGTLLYYLWAVDSTLAAALSTIAPQQSSATKKTEESCHQFLDYAAAYRNAAVQFMASDMILAVHLDVLYLSKSNARSQAAGHFYLATKNDEDYNNGAILILSTIIQHVVALASEAKLAALFYNAREAVPLHVTLEEMGYP